MTDYPDWTGLEHIVGTNIMLAVDVQGGYIMLPVDWQSQFAGVFLQPDWTALQGTDKNFNTVGASKTWGQFIVSLYTVPAGKTLYICGASFAIHTTAAADYDHFIRGILHLLNNTDAITLAVLGGESGANVSFPKPLVLAAGKQFALIFYNRSNVTCELLASCWGYEI